MEPTYQGAEREIGQVGLDWRRWNGTSAAVKQGHCELKKQDAGNSAPLLLGP